MHFSLTSTTFCSLPPPPLIFVVDVYIRSYSSAHFYFKYFMFKKYGISAFKYIVLTDPNIFRLFWVTSSAKNKKIIVSTSSGGSNALSANVIFSHDSRNQRVEVFCNLEIFTRVQSLGLVSTSHFSNI